MEQRERAGLCGQDATDLSAEPLRPAQRIDDLSFFSKIVRRIHVKSGSRLATGKQHRTLELDASELERRHVRILLGALVQCAACASHINPFRARRGKKPERAPEKIGRLFVSVCCRLGDSVGCARGNAATAELERLVGVILAAQGAPEPPPAPRPQCHPVPAPPQAAREPNQLGLRGVW